MKPTIWKNAPRVFIIDDSATDCLLMSNSLQRAGYEVSMATDGREGLRSVLANPPQSLILDVVLPGMNGYAICRHLRAVDPHHIIPIVVVSTKRTLLDQNYVLSLGADRYLAKPFTGEMLVQTIGEVLPASLRAIVTQTRRQAVPQHDALEELTRSGMRTLIPYRLPEANILRVSNPFADSAVMTDKQIRRLYAAIDGYKTVQDLSYMMHLDLQATLKLLKTLWQQQRIAFYDTEQRPLKGTPEF